MQLSARRQADLAAAGVPHLDDFVLSEDLRQMADLTFGTMVLGRAYAISSQVPAERVAALRSAFMATLADNAFVADADKARIDIVPAAGEEVAARVKRFYAISLGVIDRVKKVTAAP